MPSRIAQELSLRHPPLTLSYAPEAPPEAKSFKAGGGWGCVMFLLAQAARGAAVSFSRETCLCPGAVNGMGLGLTGNEDFPGGPEAFARFLSTGNQDWEPGRAAAEQMRANGADREMLEEYLHGEGFKKSPELTWEFMKGSPVIEPEGPVVLVKPLEEADYAAPPKVVILLADAEQLSALVVLANYGRSGIDNVRIPFGSGCQSLGLYPLYEAARAESRAVVGLTDISARLYLRKLLGRDLVSFALPWAFFQEMEENAPQSFLSRQAWRKLRQVRS